MQLKANQLGNHLKRSLAPIYIISGDEPLQISECADQIRHQAKGNGFIERTVYHVDPQFDWHLLLSAANSMSLFAEKTLIELRMRNSKLSSVGQKALQEYTRRLFPDNVLLIITHRLDGQAQRAKWFGALTQVGVFIPVWPIPPDQLSTWITHRLTAAGFVADPSAAALLADRVEGNLLAAAQEIEKLKLLAHGKMLDEEAMRAIVTDNARYDVFQLADTALAGRPKNCVRILDSLKGEGIEASVVLWALAREIRLLSHLSRQLAKGFSQNQALAQSAKIVGYSLALLKRKQTLIFKAIARHNERQYRNMLVLAGQLDQQIKSFEKNDAWSKLLTLTLILAGLPMSESLLTNLAK